MFAIAAIAVLVSLAMALFRAIKGPTIFDRVLAANAVGTLCILLLSVIGFVVGRPDFLDLSIFYALINFIGVVAVLKFVERVEDYDEVEER